MLDKELVKLGSEFKFNLWLSLRSANVRFRWPVSHQWTAWVALFVTQTSNDA